MNGIAPGWSFLKLQLSSLGFSFIIRVVFYGSPDNSKLASNRGKSNFFWFWLLFVYTPGFQQILFLLCIKMTKKRKSQ